MFWRGYAENIFIYFLNNPSSWWKETQLVSQLHSCLVTDQIPCSLHAGCGYQGSVSALKFLLVVSFPESLDLIVQTTGV